MRLDTTKPCKAKSSDVSLCSKTAATKIIRLVLQPRLIKVEHTHIGFLTMSITTLTWKKARSGSELQDDVFVSLFMHPQIIKQFVFLKKYSST